MHRIGARFREYHQIGLVDIEALACPIAGNRKSIPAIVRCGREAA